MTKTIVIGGGIGGLSAAALLAKDGHEVTLIEKNEQVGGRASLWESESYKFDMGPSWYMMAEVFEKFFAKFDKTTSDFYKLTRLDPAYKIFLDGKTYEISSDIEKNIELFESLEPDGGKKLKLYLDDSKHKYETSMNYFTYRNYDSFKTMLDSDFRNHGKGLDLFKNIDQVVRKYFESDIARKILEYSIVFLGGSPHNTPAMFGMISHVDMNLGVWYPEGGIYKLIEALKSLCVDHGVQIKLNERVSEIRTGSGDKLKNEASQVVTNKDAYFCDLVISNADYASSETKLLDKDARSYNSNYWKQRTIAPSAFIIFLGIKAKIPNLIHHNLFFDTNWDKYFDELLKNKDANNWPGNPPYYVCAPSKTDSQIAPDNCENLFFTVPISTKLKDTAEVREKFYNQIIEHFEKAIDFEIRDKIAVKRIFSINDFSNRYEAYNGTALGLTHTFSQSAFFRPRHKSKKLSNLYYTGQYCHPGIGMATCIISSEIVANLIKSALNTNTPI